MEKNTVSICLSSKDILEKKFKIVIANAYDAYEVDEFLDQIINDYAIIEANYLFEKKYVDKLVNENKTLKKKNEVLEIKIKSYQARYDDVDDHPDATADNIHLIKRIDKLEKYLWKLGVNPNNIK